MSSKKLLILFFVPCCLVASAQKEKVPDSLRQLVIAARYHSGFIFAHNVHVQNTKGTKPDGFEIEYSHIKTDSSIHTQYKCYPRAGLAFTYVDFNQSLLGRSYSLSYFLEPNYRLGNRLKINVRGAAGLSYLTNPFDSAKNRQNQTYSWPVNMFLQLGIGLSYPVGKHLNLYAGGNFFHNSNGGFHQPNSGMNYINASIGIQYFTYSNHLPVYQKVKDTAWKLEPVHYDLAAYYSPKPGYDGSRQQARKYVAGGSFEVAKRVSTVDALTATAEVYYDAGLKSVKEVYRKDSTSSCTLAGLLIGHQFLFRRFIFSQQLGAYVFKQTTDFDTAYRDLYHTIYHRWGVSYKLSNHWFLGISLLAHNQIADFLDARLVYRIR